MEGPGGVQPSCADPRRLEVFHDGFDAGNRSTYHLVRPVVRRDIAPDTAGRIVAAGRPVQPFQFGCDPFRGRKNRGHCAFFGTGQQDTPRGGEPHPVFQAEYPRGVRRGQFADAVAHDHGRPHAHARPEGRQRTFQRKERRLLPGRVVQRSYRFVSAEHHVQQRGPADFLEHRFTAVQYRTGHGLLFVKRLAHADPLASLPGVDECDFRRFEGVLDRTGFGQFGEPFPQRTGIVEDHARPVIEMASSHARRPRHIRKEPIEAGLAFAVGRWRFCGWPGLPGLSDPACLPGPLVEPGQVTARQFAQRGFRFARQWKQPGLARFQVVGRSRLAIHRFRQ